MNPLMNRWQGQYSLTSQQLIPTQLLQKSFTILQMPIEELSLWVHEQILNNPALEWDVPSEEGSSYSTPSFSEKNFESHLVAKKSNKEHLLEQTQQTFTKNEDQILATDIIESLDSKGFLPEEDAQRLRFTYDLDDFERVLAIIQQLEPLGAATRNLQEFLLLQLLHKGKKGSLAHHIIAHHYELLLSANILGLAKILKISPKIIDKALKEDVKPLRLSPPLDNEGATPSLYLFPDLSIHYKDSGWQVDIHDHSALCFHVSERFMNQVETSSKDDKSYLKQMITSGNFLKNCLEKRQKTLRAIANWLIKKQKDFLLGEISTPLPCNIKDLAQALDLHPSTITRAVSEKFLDCAQGLIPLKKLFSSALTCSEGHKISQACALLELKKIVEAENKKTPMSDQQLLKALKQKGIHCARRTVAKYRNTLSIPPKARRRKLF